MGLSGLGALVSAVLIANADGPPVWLAWLIGLCAVGTLGAAVCELRTRSRRQSGRSDAGGA